MEVIPVACRGCHLLQADQHETMKRTLVGVAGVVEVVVDAVTGQIGVESAVVAVADAIAGEDGVAAAVEGMQLVAEFLM